jgi:FMN phosphatase YigB (HAD superfamily)
LKRTIPVTTLFLDVGGVLLTDGWDHLARKRAATTFTLIEDRRGQQRSKGIEFASNSKPDADIFRLALDIAQVQARQVVYIENTPLFVQIAEDLGIRSILHTDDGSTSEKLASFGLRNDEGVINETG